MRYTPRDDVDARRWLEQRLEVFRLESAEGEATGLATGYFEPLVEARRKPGGAFPHAAVGAAGHGLRRAQADLGTRQEIDQVPEAQASVRGREIAYLADPLDALMLQIQGSGRLHIVEGRWRRGAHVVRLAFAGNNEQPYRSVGRWLIDQGELTADRGLVADDQGLGAAQSAAACRALLCSPSRAWCGSARSRCARRPRRPARRPGRAVDARPLDRGRPGRGALWQPGVGRHPQPMSAARCNAP